MVATAFEPPGAWSRLRRRVLRPALFLAAALAAFWVVILYLDARIRAALADLERADPGWRLEGLLAARDVVTPEENSAPVVTSVFASLPEEWPSREFSLSLEGALRPERLSQADYARLCNELNEWEPALVEARKIADIPRGRHRITPAQSDLDATPLTDQQGARKVATLLQADAIRHLEDGDADRALADCRAIVNVGRSIGDEPFVISQMIRTHCVVLGCRTAAHVLSLAEPSPDELAALQKLLDQEDAFPELWYSMRSTRAQVHETCTAVETGQRSLATATGTSPNATEQTLSLVLRPEFKYEHPQILATMTRYVEVALLPMHEQMSAEAGIEADIRDRPRTAVLGWLLVPTMGKVAKGSWHKHAILRCAIASLAAERYRRANSRWPGTLGDLVPVELSRVPSDPYDGGPLLLARPGGGIAIYSVGPDAKDDGGIVAGTAQDAADTPGTDVGFFTPDPSGRWRKSGAESDHARR
jgi:hypothetical protein